MIKKALLTGTGQDSSYLCEYLLSLGYKVFATIRRQSTPENQESRIAHLSNQVTTFYADLTDYASIEKVISEVMPDEIYNLAAMSHVRISFDIPQNTAMVNAIGVLNVIEAAKKICPNAKILQASSSEMFGNSVDVDGFQRISTPMNPVSPYGCSKLYAYHITKTYRKSYGMNIYNSICFNHESPRRGSNFVTNKVVKGAVRIKLGLQQSIELGNLDSFRDWGHSKDYVRAMHLILQQDPGDYVVATGITHSVREMIQYVFNELGLDFDKHIVIDEKFKRPQELDYLKGDATEIRALGWKPEYTFETMLDEMIEHWMNYYKPFDPLKHEQSK